MVSHIGFHIIKQHIEDFNKSLIEFEKIMKDIPEDQVLELAGNLQASIKAINNIKKCTNFCTTFLKINLL